MQVRANLTIPSEKYPRLSEYIARQRGPLKDAEFRTVAATYVLALAERMAEQEIGAAGPPLAETGGGTAPQSDPRAKPPLDDVL